MINKKFNRMCFCISILGLLFTLNSNIFIVNASEIVSSLSKTNETNTYNTNVTSLNNNIDVKENIENKNKMNIIKNLGLENLAINNTNDITYIYEKADLTSQKLAILPPNGVCQVINQENLTNLDTFLKKDSEYFIYIKSDNYEGYVLSKDITMNLTEDNFEFKYYAIVLSDTECYKANTEKIFDIKTDTILEVIGYSDDNKYIKTYYNNEEVYIKSSVAKIKLFVNYAYEYEKNSNYKKADLNYTTREEFEKNIVEFAVQFVGNKYVWGGTSLTNGADCSGFVQTIYRNFGYSMDRVASAQVDDGTEISENELKVGDLVFYSDGSGISHVAMYIGDGNIIHASNSKPYPQGGIKISPYNYQKPSHFTRIANDI